MKAWNFLRCSAVAVGALVMSTAANAQNFPSKPIDLSVWAAPGGGTDTTNRFLAQAMERLLRGKINVTNRTGGGGGVAMTHVWNQPHDGYTWLGASEAQQIVKAMEFHKTGTSDWRWYMVAGSPGVISVRAESPYKTLDDLINAAKKSPKSIKVGHCAIGCVWHMRAIALGQASGSDFNNIPFDGSGPAHLAALTGEADAVVSGIAEQTEFVRGGKLRPLAMIEMKPFDFPKFGLIPAAGEKYPDIEKIPARQWLGMAIPKATPKPIIDQIDAAFVAAMKDARVMSLATDRNFQLYGEFGDEAEKTLLAMEKAMSWKLFELGVAKTSPDKLGIPKP